MGLTDRVDRLWEQVIHEEVERVAAEEGLDPAELRAEAERIASRMVRRQEQTRHGLG